MLKDKLNSGAVLLEILFSVSFILLISGLLFRHSYVSIKSSLQSKNQSRISIKALKVTALLSNLMTDADSQRLDRKSVV